MPTISISNQPVLASVAHLPRNHLGSQLYDVTLSVPSNAVTPADAKFQFESNAKVIPRFSGRENCTFTVRVPRGYIGSTANNVEPADIIAGGLEEICRRRAVWGTDVYTDDSDPVAAAVHSGWLRGDFGAYNDDIHDLLSDGEDDEQPSTLSVMSERPKKPVRIPADVDLHITVLILPTLEKYTATLQNNLRSRKWKDHDGMSYMIHSIGFVNEAVTSRYTERGGAARRERMKAELEKRKAAEGLLDLLNGSNRVPVGA